MNDWLNHVALSREDNAKVSNLSPQARQAAAHLYFALISVCEDKALVIVEKAGYGEGLESWRLLLRRYEPRSRQSRVVKHIELLNWDFTNGELVDNLEQFDSSVAKYEQASGKTVDHDEKIGLIIKGIPKGSLQEHLLLYSERCDNYAEFRAEIDTIAKAQHTGILPSQPVDISALAGKGGSNRKFDGNCNNCGKKGHMAADCWSKQKGGQKGAGKGRGKASRTHSGKNAGRAAPAKKKCFQGGMTNHVSKDCRGSDEKKRAWKSKQKNAGVNEISEDAAPDMNGLGAFSLCQLRVSYS